MKINTFKTWGKIVVIISAASVIGCSQKSTNKKNNASSTNPFTNPNPTGTATPSPYPTYTPGPGGNCPHGDASAAGTADAGQTIEYYKINSPEIIAHGASGGTIVFSSESDLPTNYNQNIFFSDTRFNVRVIPKYQNKGVDSRGIPCAYSPQPFTKMNVGIVLRSRQSSPGVGAYHQFKDVPVNCPSKVHEFQVPSTSDPLVVEVMNVEWDWSCKSYEQQGYPNVPGVCPYDNVWQTECYKLEVQFATDTTKNIPGTRTY
ncbi:MAG: hypothetical protein NXH75_09175 [Halobacteriovoraceae bacterium]|nr:hypothetical protein [Halobacteriovoraceae bacterium]